MSLLELSELLKSKKVIVCVGTGGVGKTTTAAVLAMQAAELGLKTLAITVDPAKRLASTLGIDRHLGEAVEVEGFSGKLYGMVVNAPVIFDRFLKETMHDQEKIERIKKNRLYVQLKTRLHGSQEFTSLEALYENFHSGQYDLIVLDTPPAQNAVDFLEAPQKLHALFDSSVTKWFLGQSSEENFFKRMIASGSEKVFSALKTLTGKEFIEELQEFFELAQSWQGELSHRMRETQKILNRADGLFLLVTGFDEAKLEEALSFRKKLKREGYPVGAVVVNRMLPGWSWQSPVNEKLQLEIQEFYKKRQQSLREFYKELGKVETFHIPQMEEDVSDLDGLKSVGQRITYSSQICD